jgi:hypothetical protein
LLALCIQVAGGLVQNEDLGRCKDRPCNGQALLLAARELDATLADIRLVPLGQLHDELVGIGSPCGIFYFGIGRIVVAVGDVVAHRPVEKKTSCWTMASSPRYECRRKSRMSLPMSRIILGGSWRATETVVFPRRFTSATPNHRAPPR